MVHPNMVGITELMCDDCFLDWLEKQDNQKIFNLSSFEVYNLYTQECGKK